MNQTAKDPESGDPLALFDAEPDITRKVQAEAEGLAAPAETAEPDLELQDEGLSVEALLSSRLPVHWLEAVAIMERVTAALVNEDGEESAAPDPSGIVLEPDGSVRVLAGDGSVLSANRLGRTLHALASAGPMPAPLRLLVTKWIETEEPLPVADVQRALTHFVRPDGASLIKAVYERGMAVTQKRPSLQPRTQVAPVASAAAPAPVVATAPPAPRPQPAVAAKPPASVDRPVFTPRPTEPPKRPAVFFEPAPAADARVEPVVEAPSVVQPHAPARTASALALPAMVSSARRLAPQVRVVVHGLKWPAALKRVPAPNVLKAVGVAAGVVVLLGGTLWLLSSSGSSPAQATTTTASVSAPIEPIPFGQSIELPAEPDTTAPGRPGARPAVRAASRPAAAAAGTGARTAPAARRAAAPATATAGAAAPERAAAPPVVNPAPAAQAPTAAPPSLSVLAARPPAAPSSSPIVFTRGTTGRVYTDADREVEPPIMVYPQVRPGTLAGPESDFNTMEIVVSERGMVEQVRLLTTPKRMTDMMLLSGAKTWRFEPASVAGAPVRYRMAITWPTTR
jgi:hypothetical protein